MSKTRERGTRLALWVVWIAAALTVGLMARFDWTSPEPAAPEPEAPQSEVVAPVTSVPAALAAQPALPKAEKAAPAQPAPAPADDPELDGHPHPITAEHVRIQRELVLIQQLNDALDLRDAAQLRALITQYEQHVPGDPNALAAGYARIADCLEHPDDHTRDLAREYYTREKASTLRRYVRRVCFDDAPGGVRASIEAAKL